MKNMYKSIVKKYCDGVGYKVKRLLGGRIELSGRHHEYVQLFDNWEHCYVCLCDQIETSLIYDGAKRIKDWLGEEEWGFIKKDWGIENEVEI